MDRDAASEPFLKLANDDALPVEWGACGSRDLERDGGARHGIRGHLHTDGPIFSKIDALDLNVQEALLGKIAAEDALKNTATAWEKITNQIGRRQQIDGWKALKAAYPTKNVPD